MKLLRQNPFTDTIKPALLQADDGEGPDTLREWLHTGGWMAKGKCQEHWSFTIGSNFHLVYGISELDQPYTALVSSWNSDQFSTSLKSPPSSEISTIQYQRIIPQQFKVISEICTFDFIRFSCL